MNNLLNNYIKLAIAYAFHGDLSRKSSMEIFSKMLSGRNICKVAPKKTIIYRDDKITHVYLLVKGHVSIININPLGLDILIDEMNAPQIFGLVETLNHVDVFSAYVISDTDCVYLKIPTLEFISCIKNDHELCFEILEYVNCLALRNMDSTEIKSLIHPKDILGNFLYRLTINHTLPYTLKDTRAKLSETFHINLRTLYRYVKEFEGKGMLTLTHGKIVITKENFEKLSQKYDELNL